LVGAQPVTIQAAELLQALATGAVETFAISSATGHDSKVWEQVMYRYRIYMSLPKNLFIVNQQAFFALDNATQDAVVKAAANAEERGWTLGENQNKWYLEHLAKNGMKVEKLSAKFQSA